MGRRWTRKAKAVMCWQARSAKDSPEEALLVSRTSGGSAKGTEKGRLREASAAETVWSATSAEGGGHAPPDTESGAP